MRVRKLFVNRLNILSFVLAQVLLSVYADAMAWTGYPARYAVRWQPPVAYQAVPPAYARPAYPVRGYPFGHLEEASAEPAGKTGDGTSSGSQDSDPGSGAERKAQFIKDLLPVVQAENEGLLDTRQRLGSLQQRVGSGRTLSERQLDWLNELAADYRIDAGKAAAELLTELLVRVDVIPAGLAIAQAANESAWGTSRFAREGNNLFGVWTWDEDKGLKPKRRAAGKTHLVRVYDSQGESVHDYMLNLNSHPAYQPLRKLRAQLREQQRPLSALRLAEGLEAYSELGDEYIRRIQSMIRANDLEQVAGRQLADASLSE